MAPKRAQSRNEMASRFLVVSLGNPKPYLDTLHSAGHITLQALQKILSYENPPFSTSGGRSSAPTSAGSKYALVQSTAMMNVSGPAVLAAWRRFSSTDPGQSPILVLVHDDLESKLGEVKMRKWDASGKGHNGVKSAKGTFSGYPKEVTSRWARITVGIGRPDTREKAGVSDYVLRRMTGAERKAIEGAAADVLEKLVEYEEELEEEAEEAVEKAQARAQDSKKQGAREHRL
jgi:peptidyl-tRNA hydrolase, PTH1 family